MASCLQAIALSAGDDCDRSTPMAWRAFSADEVWLSAAAATEAMMMNAKHPLK
jgi:hypothetical protein